MKNIVTDNSLLFDDVIKQLPNNIWNPPDYSDGCYDYYAQRPIDEGYKVIDCSFLIEEDEPLILFRGATIEIDNRVDLVFAAEPCVVFEFKKGLTKTTKKVFRDKFDEVFEKINGTIWCRDFLNNGQLSILSLILMSKGATAEPMFSQVIDLAEDKSLLWRKIRKSYSSLINNGLRDLEPIILDKKTITWEHMQEFRSLHIREAGRETRSEESWRRQFEIIKSKQAFLVLGKINDTLVSAGLFIYNEINCRYWVSASRRELFDKPLFHAIMWTAILYAKNLGCRWFELGEKYFPNHPEDRTPTTKELGISDFKSGFGGETRMFLDLKLGNSLVSAL